MHNGNTMKDQGRLQRILWTVDPFEEDKALLCSAGKAIKNLTQNAPAEIQPIYLYKPYPYEITLSISNELFHKIELNWQGELAKIQNRIKLEYLRPLHIFSEPYLSVREGVDRINQVAQRWKADLIVTSTHARRGIKRWVLGSFAETLLLHSTIHVFSVNPFWRKLNKFKSILFPTDFSEASAESFDQILKISKTLRCEVALFHKLIYSLPLIAPLPPDAFPIYMEAFDIELDARRKDLSKWVEKAKVEGIQIQAEIDHREDCSIADAILKRAKNISGFIALSTFSGSTTRKVIRASPLPVWVLHPSVRIQAKEYGSLKKAA
jgi:nucleotide-binding universal stress UspA family protein